MPYSYAWGPILSPGNAVDFFPENNPYPFETDTPAFSRSNAWWLSELSRLIYLRGPNEFDMEGQTAARNYFLGKVGLEERWFYNGSHVQCAIVGTTPGTENGFSVLIFRGTRGRISNWLYNLSTGLSSWPLGGKVHNGFKRLILEAWEEILPHLSAIPTPIYYTGHSLGGALAVLAAALKEPAAVYTFGSPRIGDTDFVRATKSINIYRVASARDIVAGVLPFSDLLHAGEPHCLPHLKALDSQRSWFDAPGFLADHSPLNYTVQL